MADLTHAISSMVALLVVAALGYLAARLGYLDAAVRPKLSKLILNVTLPCTILASVAQMDASAGADQLAWAFGFAALSFPLMLAAGALCVVLLRVPKGQRHLYIYVSLFTNTGFIGIAVVSSIFGGGAAFLGSIFVAVINLFFYSIGVAILCSGSNGGGKHGFDWKSMLNAPLVSSVAAILLFATGLALPAPLAQAAEIGGAATAPLAMMLVGLSVAESGLRSMLGEWRLYGLVLVRFLALPALAAAVITPFGPDPVALGVLCVMLAMPTGAMAAALAAAYGQDPELPAKATIVTTLASFVTVPLVMALLVAL